MAKNDFSRAISMFLSILFLFQREKERQRDKERERERDKERERERENKDQLSCEITPRPSPGAPQASKLGAHFNIFNFIRYYIHQHTYTKLY